MNIQTKKLPKNLAETLVEMSFSEMEPFYQQSIKELSQDIKIPGFRPGKAPLDLVKKEIGEMKILERGAEMAINDKYSEIIEKQQLITVAPPQVQIQKLAPYNPCVFKLTVPLMPQVKLGNYHKIKIKKNEKPEVKDEEIGKALDKLQQIRGKEVSVNRELRHGDKAQIDLNLFIDKIPLENGQIKDFYFIVGQDQYLPGLSKNLKGLKRDEEKEFSFTYPLDHYDRKLAGKKVDFKAKIKNVYQIDLPALDDKFAEAVGPFKTISGLKEKIKENLLAEKKHQEEQKTEIEILNQLIEISKFEELPEVLIERELDKILEELRENVENEQVGSFKFEDYLKAIKKSEEDLRKDFIPQAEKRIKTALAIREIALKEKIEAAEREVEEEVEELKKVFQGQEQTIKNLGSETGKIYAKNLLVNRKVIEWLKNQCQ